MDHYSNIGMEIRQALVEAAPNEETLCNITGSVIFSSIAFVCDGDPLSELEGCEKTYIGTRVEKQFLRAFDLIKCKPLDTTVAGHPIDLKFTLGNNWMIPPECVGHFCILIKADYNQRKYSMGIFHAREENLTKGANRDRKRSVSKVGKETINWLAKDYEL